MDMRPTTAIIVLGQSLNKDKSPPATLRSRIQTTKALVEQHGQHDCLLVLCGGDPAGTGEPEAKIMQDMLHPTVPPTMLLLDVHSCTTVGNALHAVRLLKSQAVASSITSIKLVSSEFHLPRALYFFEAIFAHNGIKCPIAACPAPTPAPDSKAGGKGVNSKSLAQRVADEKRYIAKIDVMLADHFTRERETLAAAGVSAATIVNYGPAPPPPSARKGQALAELELVTKLAGKEITFIRHAQSLYNVYDKKKGGDAWLNTGLRDAALSPEGCKQAATLTSMPWFHQETPELLVASPLTRAIQTAAYGFGGRGIKLNVCNLIGEKIDAYSDQPRALPEVLADHPWIEHVAFTEVVPSRSKHCKAEGKRIADGKVFAMVGSKKNQKG